MADALPCPGKRSPVRPSVLLPMCRTCKHQQDGAKRAAPAKHDGVTWSCQEHQERRP